MARVTSKLQVTIPKVIANLYGIQPGSEIDWLPAGEAIRVVPHPHERAHDRGRRLELFDRATELQRARDSGKQRDGRGGDRGWRRDDLYDRGGSG